MEEGHAGHRHQRLQQLIDEELSSLLRDEAQDPRLQEVRTTAVELSIDYKSARVRWITTDANPSKAHIAKIEAALERATPFLRARMGHALDLKRLPSLNFVYDRDAAAGVRAAAIKD